MAIHEKSLIDADRIQTNDNLVLDGVDVSGHWNTMVLPRYLKDYDTDFARKIRTFPVARMCIVVGNAGRARTRAPCTRRTPISIPAIGSI